jgi:hypothetical protein
MTSEGDRTLNLYPNPAHNVLTVEHDAAVNTLDIVNTLGQTLHTVQPKKDAVQTTINTSDLVKGIYYLRVNQTEMVRFVKF